MAVGDVARVSVLIEDLSTGKVNTNNYHYQDTSAIARPTLEEVRAAFLALWNTASGEGGAPLKNFVTSNYQVIGVRRQYVEPLEAPVDSFFGVPIVGTAVGESSSPSTAIVVSLRTAHAGRRGRGRIYLPAFGEGILTGGSIDATEAEDIAEQHHQLAIDLLIADALLSVYSKADLAPYAVTAFKVDRRGRVQRRRQSRAPVYFTEEAL